MVRRKDLADIGDSDFSLRQREYMQCQECFAVIGGTRGDYWQYALDHVFHCPECKSDNIAIVQDRITQEIIKQ